MSNQSIDFLSRPFCPRGYSTRINTSWGIRRIYIIIDVEEILKNLVLVKISDTDKLVCGVEIINNEKITRSRNCGSQLLDFLLENPTMIPKDWDNKNILFLATSFASVNFSTAYTYISCLYQEEGRWTRKMISLGNRDFDPKTFVVATIKG
jgi:hypothetical protein